MLNLIYTLIRRCTSFRIHGFKTRIHEKGLPELFQYMLFLVSAQGRSQEFISLGAQLFFFEVLLIIMKRVLPWNEPVDVISSDDSSSSDAEVEAGKVSATNNATDSTAIDEIPIEVTPEGAIIKRAEMYQEYMNHIPIPTKRGSVIPFRTWTGLGKSTKQLYRQPLHYLTNKLLKQWDQQRIGDANEERPLDTIIHPSKAEATIWLVEELHRCTTSPRHIAKLWLADPMHYYFVDPIFPKLSTKS